MVIFHSYVKLPEGSYRQCWRQCWRPMLLSQNLRSGPTRRRRWIGIQHGEQGHHWDGSTQGTMFWRLNIYFPDFWCENQSVRVLTDTLLSLFSTISASASFLIYVRDRTAWNVDRRPFQACYIDVSLGGAPSTEHWAVSRKWFFGAKSLVWKTSNLFSCFRDEHACRYSGNLEHKPWLSSCHQTSARISMVHVFPEKRGNTMGIPWEYHGNTIISWPSEWGKHPAMLEVLGTLAWRPAPVDLAMGFSGNFHMKILQKRIFSGSAVWHVGVSENSVLYP